MGEPRDTISIYRFTQQQEPGCLELRKQNFISKQSNKNKETVD